MDLVANSNATLQKNVTKMTTNMPGHADTFNPYFQRMLDNDAALEKKIQSLEQTVLQGQANYNSILGITVPHSLGHTEYIVNITAIENPDGDLGDVYITKSANAFTVFNSGRFKGQFRYQIVA